MSSPPPTPNSDVNMPMTKATIGKVDEKSDHIMSPKFKMHQNTRKYEYYSFISFIRLFVNLFVYPFIPLFDNYYIRCKTLQTNIIHIILLLVILYLIKI